MSKVEAFFDISELIQKSKRTQQTTTIGCKVDKIVQYEVNGLSLEQKLNHQMKQIDQFSDHCVPSFCAEIRKTNSISQNPEHRSFSCRIKVVSLSIF